MEKNNEMIVLGDEAVAQAAIDAGIKGAYSYPGTPATEILEYMISKKPEGVHAHWSANEKVAYEESLGMSYIGHRAIVSMKHVGLNVAADPFMNSALTGVNGGLVVVVADDPGMHSSQNEQDSRYFAEFAQVPCFEPANQQECYEMTKEAFELSEKFAIPVMLRLVTRLSHSRATIELSEKRNIPQNMHINRDKSRWILTPANATVQNKKLREKHIDLIKYAEGSGFNHFSMPEAKSEFGIIASGIAHTYVLESMKNMGIEVPVMKIGFYPFPETKVHEFASYFKKVLVIEEGYPFVEKAIRRMSIEAQNVYGKYDQTLPLTGELTPDNVRVAIHTVYPKGNASAVLRAKVDIPTRPPELCKGCSHRDSYTALNEALKGKENFAVFADIGCYTLGSLPPFNSIDTTVNMGASVSMAKAAGDGGLKYSIGVIGDSTFLHSGISPLIGAIYENSNMLLMILDNATTGMTGGQTTMVVGEKLVALVKGLGVNPEHVRVIEAHPRTVPEMTKIINEELEYQGLSVIIAQRECIQTAKKKSKA